MDLTELNNQLNSLQFDFQNNDKMQNNDINNTNNTMNQDKNLQIKKQLPNKFQPPKWLKLLSLLGIFYLISFSIIYIILNLKNL